MLGHILSVHFGIEGVKLGEKRMTMWSETTPTSANRARKYGTDQGAVESLADDIDQNGIDTKLCRRLY